MSTPRQHAHIIKAWADGASVQYRKVGDQSWIDCQTGSCTDGEDIPPFGAWHSEWRVKPAPVSHKVYQTLRVVAQIGTALDGHAFDISVAATLLDKELLGIDVRSWEVVR